MVSEQPNRPETVEVQPGAIIPARQFLDWGQYVCPDCGKRHHPLVMCEYASAESNALAELEEEAQE